MKYMDKVRCDHIGLNGPGLWNILHGVAVRATTPHGKLFFLSFLDIFKDMIKCKHCSEDLSLFIRSHNLSDYQNIIIDGIDIGYFKWTCELHNHVNTKLNKPFVSLTEAYKYYTTRHFDCKSCINLDTPAQSS